MIGIETDKSRWVLWALLAAWIGFLAFDFHHDVKDRDCFTWMDPQQYHGFAEHVFSGVRSADDFEVPSIFPFFLLPLVSIDSSVGTVLWVNVCAAVLLFIGVSILAREFKLRTPAILLTAIILCSPLMVGLSRSLYLEFSLTALVAVAFAIYVRMIRRDDPGIWIGFGGMLYVGILTKMTFPLFFIVPAGCQFIGYVATGCYRRALMLVGVFVIPSLLAVGTVWGFFSEAAFEYYRSRGNTAIPIMYLVGPIERWSFESITYYLWVLATLMLGLITPLLLLALLFPRWEWRRLQWSWLLSPRAVLWMWLVGPLLLLVPQLVKEPRHVAPCIVPAVLLIAYAIESIPQRWFRVVSISLLCGLSLVQYFTSTSGDMKTAYFLDGPVKMDAIQRELAQPEINNPVYLTTPPALIQDHWRFNQNVALIGFDPNQSLAMSWALWPAVVVDMSIYDKPKPKRSSIWDFDYQDLSIISIFDTLNRRCGWEYYQFPLSEREVLENADYLFVKIEGEEPIPEQAEGFEVLTRYQLGGGLVYVLRNVRPARVPWRQLYGMQYLATHANMTEKEQNTVAFDLCLTAALRGDLKTASEVQQLFPAITQARYPRRSIYYIAGMGDVLHRDVERNIYRHMLMRSQNRR